jgi:DNA-binding PadR family transcriptional regulator
MSRRSSPLSLEHILLGFVNQGPVHGYDLYKQITHFAGISLVWYIKQSQLYALLDKLEADGLLSSVLVMGEMHPNRKEYRITEEGRQVFDAWVSSPVKRGRDMRQEFIAKIYFARMLGPEISLPLVEKQRLACLEWLSTFQQGQAQTSEDQDFERMVFQFRISQIEAMLNWLDNCRSEIQRTKEPA